MGSIPTTGLFKDLKMKKKNVVKKIIKKRPCEWHEGCGKKDTKFFMHKWLCDEHVKELTKRIKLVIKSAWRKEC